MVKPSVGDACAGIDLTNEHIRNLAGRRIEREGRGQRPFGMYCFAAGEPDAELARAVERRVFAHTFGNTQELMDLEYAPYDAHSIFTCILDHRRCLPVAACRLIMPGGLGWKTMDDLARYWGTPGPMAFRRAGIDVDAAQLWDCATLAVEPEYRKSFIVQAIMGSIGLVADAVGASVIIGMIDCRVLRIAQALCGRPWNILNGFEPRGYLDSPATVPIWASVEEVRQRLHRSQHPAYGVFFDPTSFEPAIAALQPEDVRAVVDRLRSPSAAAPSRH